MLDRLLNRPSQKEILRKHIENHWLYQYGVDITEVANFPLGGKRIYNHEPHMEFAEKSGLLPISFRRLLQNEEFKMNLDSVVLFDTGSVAIPGNHWTVVGFDEGKSKVRLRFCSTFGNQKFEFQDGRPLEFIIPMDEEFFTGFTLMDYKEKGTGRSATVHQVQVEGFKNFSSKTCGNIYFSTPEGLQTTIENKKSEMSSEKGAE